MADNITLPATGTGTADVTVATDLIAGVTHPRVKMEWGADGTAVDASAANPVPMGQKAGTATLSNVSASASSVTVLASNADRLAAVIVNDSSVAVYLKYGSAASSTSYTYKVAAGGVLEITKDQLWYTGIITGIWVSATGSARVTELTA